MARNGVQFQKGLGEPAFEQQYGTEEQCRAIVVSARWPRGFECPACGGTAPIGLLPLEAVVKPIAVRSHQPRRRRREMDRQQQRIGICDR
jgi:Transposase zinc-ribbon domain